MKTDNGRKKMHSRSFDLGGVDLNIFLDSLEKQTGLPGWNAVGMICRPVISQIYTVTHQS